MKVAFFFFCMMSCLQGWSQASVLSSGSWYKVGITETGLYKIDKDLLEALGVPNSVNPKKIKIYGNGVKGTLPQVNSVGRPIDLVENAIFIAGQEDESFDDEDYILFYGIGPDKEIWIPTGLEYEKNIYADTSFYFLRIDGKEGKRVSAKPSIEGLATITASSFDDFITYEQDKTNLISSGRGWYGEILSSGESKSFTHAISGLVSPVDMVLSVVSQSSENATFDVSVNSSKVGEVSIDGVPDGPGTTYAIKARQQVDTMSFAESSPFDLKITFNGNVSGERGFIDFYIMTFKRNLKLYGNETDFRWKENVGEVIRYEVGGGMNINIWDVSDPTEVKSQEFTLTSGKGVFKSQSSIVEEYVVFEGKNFPSPFIFGEVKNQNIRSNTDLDGIIITHPAFKQAADQLAQFHREHDDLTVKVVTITQVYNEFSAGRQDITAIRDYARHVYSRSGKLKYLLLMGDCSYDYKDRILNNTNFVPTYESRNSFHPIFSYSSDDYFGFFDDDEGEWEESSAGDHTLEIGVGRLPAKSLEEAQAMVNKIIYYSTSPNTLGNWREELTYVADDGDGNIHVRHVEDLSALIDTTYVQYNINKILLDAFTQEESGATEKSPQTSAALKARIKNGTFLINYIGHGNERLWMEEEILTLTDIEELTNKNKLPIFVTATCEFGRNDNPSRVSGAEQLLLLPQGGGIALLTTSRPVFASTNFTLNLAFHKNIFKKEAGMHLRLGDVIRQTKNEGLEGPVNRNFILLGDPMLLPAYPSLEIVVNEIGNGPDTLKALEKVVYTGQIMQNGIVKDDFHGVLSVEVYDVKQSFKTKGQESAPYTYTLRNSALFRGEATVKEGIFSFSFIIPKSISYQYKHGKVTMYAWDTSSNIDAVGAFREVIIGGTVENPPSDNNPPHLVVFMNDSSFVDGSIVGDSPLLIAKVSDESGITTTQSGVIEGITMTMKGEVVNLNSFYTAERDDFRKGTVVYPFQDLPPGDYTATIKVFDTYNNVSETSVNFTVSDAPILFVYNPITYPNPAIQTATFSFDHDREDEDLSISLFIYNPGGEVVSSKELLIENSTRNVSITWATKTNRGTPLNPGVYYARLMVRSRLDGATKEITQKLVIIN